jgi:hypothetical protein
MPGQWQQRDIVLAWDHAELAVKRLVNPVLEKHFEETPIRQHNAVYFGLNMVEYLEKVIVSDGRLSEQRTENR